MIFIKVLETILYILKKIFLDITIPNIPDSAIDIINEVADYVGLGFAILGNYCDLDYIITLFLIFLAIDFTLDLINFIVWICRKIPMLGVS